MQMTQYLKWYEYATKNLKENAIWAWILEEKATMKVVQEWNAEIIMNPSICETIQGT